LNAGMQFGGNQPVKEVLQPAHRVTSMLAWKG
jgi:hypothetical protein